MKDFKKAYQSNGIHVYDINMAGNYGNGNGKGVLTFKVRKNDDNEGFNDKLKEINSKVVKDFKAEMKTKSDTNRRPM